MKYIRTEDGHIYCEKDEMTGELLAMGYYSITHGSPIIDVKDTIEELCDKWVYDNFFGEKNVIKDIEFSSLDKMIRIFKKKLVSNIRLAIWTDKGLIYVAKMSEKGELELL